MIDDLELDVLRSDRNAAFSALREMLNEQLRPELPKLPVLRAVQRVCDAERAMTLAQARKALEDLP